VSTVNGIVEASENWVGNAVQKAEAVAEVSIFSKVS
jgi:hypothetical protein